MSFGEIYDLVLYSFSRWGYLIIFFGSLIEITPLGWMIPGGGILLIAGFIAKTTGDLPLVPVILTGTFGAWIALSLAYLIGKRTGMWLVKKLHQERNANIAKAMLANHGGMILTTSMLANLTRFWIAFVAGVDKYNFWSFSVYSLIASSTWVSLMVFVGFFAGYEIEELKKVTGILGIVVWILAFVAVYVIYRFVQIERKKFLDSEIEERGGGLVQ